MFKPLDPLLNSELRLAVMSLLIGLEEADFRFLKEKTAATAGNLSVQLQKLKTANYIEIEKSFKGNYPLTTCKITKEGIKAFESYVEAIKSYINREHK
ncbi:MAG: transcriptional regulator [Bacteroidetes bacterium 4572_77]|nr:MAG: transcriptional regulator [Bacteroidetes bacterium 4572_77]